MPAPGAKPGVALVSVYAALPTLLSVKPESVASALIVSLAATLTGDEYVCVVPPAQAFAVSVGVDPSVV